VLDVWKTVYNLEGASFHLDQGHHFSFERKSYNDTRAYLKYAMCEGEGNTAITGTPGTGKTTLIFSLIAELGLAHIHVGAVSDKQLGADCTVALGNLKDRAVN
jgi:type IV secretory pathway VirB4 component